MLTRLPDTFGGNVSADVSPTRFLARDGTQFSRTEEKVCAFSCGAAEPSFRSLQSQELPELFHWRLTRRPTPFRPREMLTGYPPPVTREVRSLALSFRHLRGEAPSQTFRLRPPPSTGARAGEGPVIWIATGHRATQIVKLSKLLAFLSGLSGGTRGVCSEHLLRLDPFRVPSGALLASPPGEPPAKRLPSSAPSQGDERLKGLRRTTFRAARARARTRRRSAGARGSQPRGARGRSSESDRG